LRLVVAIAALILVAYGVWRFRRVPAVLFGAGLAAVSYLPVSNLLFAIGTIRANRLLYFPSIGIAFVIGWAAEALYRMLPRAKGGGRLQRVSWRPAMVLGAVAIVGVFAYADASESTYWGDNTALFQMAERRAPNSAVVHWARGLDLTQWGKPVEGEAEFRRSLAIYPDYPQAWLGLGTALEQRGKINDALDCYQRSFRSAPNQDSFTYLAHALIYLHRYSEVLSAASSVPEALSANNKKLVAQATEGAMRKNAQRPSSIK
jgi:tetratricopeptide (TPR) repeat protein